MIYIDNNTTGFTIPRITNGIGDKVILINQTTKRRFELSTDVLNDEGYKVDITDLKLEIGQYDYVVKKNNIPLESGILQVGGYKSQNNQYEVDFNIIQYEPNIVYTPLPEKVLDVTENGVYNVESFDKVDVDVKDKESVIIIEQLENQIDTLEDEISTLEGTVSGLETEVNRLDDLKDSLQSQIDSVTTLSVTENGTYIPEEGILGWNEVNVQLEKPIFKVKDQASLRTNETEIPFDIDSTGVTNFYGMFQYCSNLTTIPQLNTSKGTNFNFMFQYCSNLTTIPQLDTSNGTNFSYMFIGCEKLTTIPQLNTSKGTNFSYMFSDCSNLTTIPQLDTSNSNNFEGMFNSCSKLTTIPQLDTSNGTNFKGMFGRCDNLTTVPQLDTSNGTNFESMLGYCTNLTTVPQLDTSNGTNFFKMFDSCPNLITIEGKLDFSKGTILNRAFSWTSTRNKKLENVQFTGSINYSIDFNPCPSLSYESVKSILTACSNTTNTNSKTLKFDRTLTDQNGELSNLIATCNTKGWTVSGLTLE